MMLIEKIRASQLDLFSQEEWEKTINSLTTLILEDGKRKSPVNQILIGHDNDIIYEKLSEFTRLNGLDIRHAIYQGTRVAIISWGSTTTNIINGVDCYINSNGKSSEIE